MSNIIEGNPKFIELQNAVEELQDTVRRHIGYDIKPKYPIQPPAEQDKCKSCKHYEICRSDEYYNHPKCTDHSAYEPKKPAEPKKYYCICGCLIKVKCCNGEWYAECPGHSDRGVHIHTFGDYPTETALVAELEKLEAKK